MRALPLAPRYAGRCSVYCGTAQRSALNRYLHEISPRVEDQVAWLERYFARPDDYYFIVEDADSGEPHGTIGIYDVDKGCGANGADGSLSKVPWRR